MPRRIFRLGLPTPTSYKTQQRDLLRTVKEAVEVGQGSRGDPLDSFVRLDDLRQLGLVDLKGKIRTPGTSGKSTAEVSSKRLRAWSLFRSS